MTDAEAAAQLARRGLPLMDPALLVAALGQVLDGGEGLVTVADVDWARFAAAFTVRRSSPLIGDLPEVRQALAEAETETAGGTEAGSALALRLTVTFRGRPPRTSAMPVNCHPPRKAFAVRLMLLIYLRPLPNGSCQIPLAAK